MSFTNAQLAQKISNLIDYWSSFVQEYDDWLGGTVDGGPGADGKYPLTNWAGVETLVESPAKLADNVSGYVGLASASEAAAAASAAAAATSESNASTSAATATAQAALADADRVAAEAAEANAVSAQNTAVVQANLATDRAGYAQEWAITAEDTLVSVAAGGNGTTDYSALHHAAKASADATSAAASAASAAADAAAAATFNPALYAALADNETISGNWQFDGTIRMSDLATETNAFLLSVTGTETILETRYAKPMSLRYNTFEKVNIHNTGINVTGIVAATGAVTGSNLNVSNWDTAYGWGDHSVAGYATVASGTFDGAVTAGNDSNTRGEVLIYSDNLTSPLNDDALAPGRIWLEGRGAYADWNIQPWQNFLYFYTDGNTIGTPSFTLQANGNAVFLGSVTASGGNSANWNTAYGWGDHAGLYEPVDASLVRSGTLTQEDNYTYLNRNNASNPVLHVAQVGAGPIAKFGKVPSLGSTGYTAEITFGADGAITAEGLTSNDVTQTARLNIVGGTSGNTHFNWNSGGENYITHGSGDFTRFRGYDGVSTYTTKMQINDSSIVMSPGANGYLEIQGSGYVVNPTGIRLGQYTSTIGYIQAPTNGKVVVWTDGTGQIVEFNDDQTSNFSGTVGVTGVVSATQGFNINNTSSSTRRGLALYNDADATDPTYGILFTGTSGYSTIGGVDGDWATFFNMNNSAGRGWIFQNRTDGRAVLGIENTGRLFAKSAAYMPDMANGVNFGADRVHYAPVLPGGSYNSNASTQTGYLRINMPQEGSSMMGGFTIRGYSYDAKGGWAVRVDFYEYTDGNGFVNEHARILYGTPPFDVVRFGTATGTKGRWILLGSTGTSWAYPQIVLTDFFSGYSGQDNHLMFDDWTIDFSTATPTGWVQESADYVGGSVRWGAGQSGKNLGGEITISTSAASGGNDGDIHFKY